MVCIMADLKFGGGEGERGKIDFETKIRFTTVP